VFISQLLSKVTVKSCSFFYKKMFNVLTLLLDAALLKCVVTEVVVFVVAFNTLTFYQI